MKHDFKFKLNLGDKINLKQFKIREECKSTCGLFTDSSLRSSSYWTKTGVNGPYF